MIDHLFTPDALLPSQYAATMQPSAMLPERALQYAVMLQAAEDLLSVDPAKTALRHAAEDWVRADDHRWPFSFAMICEGFGLDAAALRAALFRRVAEMRDQQAAARGVG